MSRRYADPIQVSPAGAAAPGGFRWRRRSYRVTAVLARWIEARPWWHDALPGERNGAAGGDRVLWRVEARAGAVIGVYDLCHLRDAHQQRWLLVRALD